MNVPIYDTATVQDLNGILELQNINLKQNTDSKIWDVEGFTTLQYSYELLLAMNNPHPHTVARVDGQVIGYCLVLLPQIIPQMEDLNPLSLNLKQLTYNGQSVVDQRYFVMGQVCVDKAYRGLGVFSQMYNHLRDTMLPTFDLVVTEISNTNQRSMHAHLHQGFEVLHTYLSLSGEPWTIVVWDWHS